MLHRLLGIFSEDLAMDLGTANTLIFKKKQGIVLNEPSVVAINNETGQVLAVGKEAKEFLGRTPARISAIRPMKDGVIADFDVTREMMKYFLIKVRERSRFFRPNLVIGVPSGITMVEKRAVVESALEAGARDIYLIEEPMAAAIGAGMAVEELKANLIVDIGGGTTEVAVISRFATAYCESIRVAGDELNEAIIYHLQKKFHLLVGENTAEQIKMEFGSAYPGEQPVRFNISGKEVFSGIPKTIPLTDRDLREGMAEPIWAIVEAIKRALEKTPPELAADISQRGLTLAGGGALLRGLDRLIHQETGLEVHVAEDPLSSVVMGAGKALLDTDFYHKVFIN
ncbi:MAG: rod shape-determining protein [Desulfobacterota bacterium]|jgi:rod shape-determining protein MreB|nr:rod shape-determining protein [Thermodesulfobacteriota bacterium]